MISGNISSASGNRTDSQEHAGHIPHVRYLLGYLLLFWILYRLFLYSRFFSPLRLLPRPKNGHPILGHLFARYEEPLGESYIDFMDTVPNNGIVLLPGLFNNDQLLVTLPEVINEVLIKRPYDFEKPHEMCQFASRIIGTGLLTAEGDVHKFQRKKMNPSFTLKNIKCLVPVTWNKSLEMINRLRDLLEPSLYGGFAVIDMNDWATRITLDVITLAAIGRDVGILRTPSHPLKHSYDEAFRGTPQKAFLFALTVCRLDWITEYFPWEINTQDKAATKFLRDFCWDAIHELRVAQNIKNEESPSLLSNLIKSNTLNDSQIVEQLLNVLAAGHETVAATFSWSIYLLATHQTVQARLREELRAHIELGKPQSDSSWQAKAIANLPLLNAVCAETIRLYPSVPITPRVATCDTSLLGTFVPQGTNVIIAPRAINRSTRLWGPQANKFDPYQWIDSDTGKFDSHGNSTSVYSMLTFLHGKRGCIGSEYAKAELRSMIAAMVCTFQLDVLDHDEPVLPIGKILTRPGDRSGKLIIRIEELREDS